LRVLEFKPWEKLSIQIVLCVAFVVNLSVPTLSFRNTKDPIVKLAIFGYLGTIVRAVILLLMAQR